MKLYFTLTLLRITWLFTMPILIIIFPQALYVKRSTIRLPEATGPKKGLLDGIEPKLKILHVGESTVAGVGVINVEEGLTANIAKELNTSTKKEVQWQIHGVNGIKLKELLEHLQKNPPDQCDIALITMGVNDTTKLTTIKKWNQYINQTITLLKPVTRGPIIFTQVPPMVQFPALPAPLKYLLGLRSAILDLSLKRICQNNSGIYHVASEPKVEPDYMAKDGYHPSELGYSEWAKSIGPKILASYEKHL